MDLFGSFSLFEVSITELVYRVEFHWTYVVAQAVAHRPCFHGLAACDPESTRAWLKSLDASDQALFRKVLNGTHITQDGKKHCQETTSDVCPFCDCSDSRYHRFWEEHFADFRSHLTQGEKDIIRDLPASLTGMGWSLHPTTMCDWNAYFAALEDVSLSPISGTGLIHLFTDGSCVDQHLQPQRFAAWAVVKAVNTGIADAQVLAAQPLPGLLQSAARAEVYATLQALRLTAEHDGPVMIWTDCDAVVCRFRKILAGHQIQMSSAHADLWSEIAQLLQSSQYPRQVTHVSAHQDPSCADTFLQEWCFVHNELVDKMAVQANYARDRTFWRLWASHCQACQFVFHYNRLVQRVQLAISQAVVRGEKPVQLDEANEEVHAAPDSAGHVSVDKTASFADSRCSCKVVWRLSCEKYCQLVLAGN